MTAEISAAAAGETRTPDAMRAEADQLKASAREQARTAFDADRQAAQLEYEAGLIETAELAAAELAGAKARLPRLQDAVAAAIAAERAAEDRVRVEDRQLARARSDQAKARADLASGQRQEELAVRVHAREQVASDVRVPLAAAQQARQAAERERDEWQRQVDVLEAECARTRHAVGNPGTAPGRPGLAPGVSGIGDMDEDTRAALALALVAMVAASGSSGDGQQQPEGPRRITGPLSNGWIMGVPRARSGR